MNRRTLGHTRACGKDARGQLSRYPLHPHFYSRLYAGLNVLLNCLLLWISLLLFRLSIHLVQSFVRRDDLLAR